MHVDDSTNNEDNNYFSDFTNKLNLKKILMKILCWLI